MVGLPVIFLDPACEIEIRAFEFSKPETAHAGVEDVHAGVRKWPDPLVRGGRGVSATLVK